MTTHDCAPTTRRGGSLFLPYDKNFEGNDAVHVLATKVLRHDVSRMIFVFVLGVVMNIEYPTPNDQFPMALGYRIRSSLDIGYSLLDIIDTTHFLPPRL